MSADPRIAARQQRYTPVQRRIAGGCHLDRDITALIEASTLTLDEVETFTIDGPKSLSSMYAGRATAT